MEWIWHAALGFAIVVVPFWVWIIVAGLVIGWAWKVFGWQGIVGALVAVLTLGAYRQGWRDHGEGKSPIVPVEPIRPPPVQPPARKKTRTLQDWLAGR